MESEARGTGSSQLRRTMSNGATVEDWIGTAKVAAEVAASYLYDATRNQGTSLSGLESAETYLEQALEEIQAVRKELGI